MRKILLCSWVLTIPMAGRAQSNRQETTGPGNGGDTARIQVMIVGVAHLVRKRDVHNSVFEDSPLSPKRQSQVADVIDHLARFRPTKVLIEESMADTVFPSRYRRFRTGQFTLPPDEAYQFGFKLAARAGDSTIYPINAWGPAIIRDSSDSGKRINDFLTANVSRITTPSFQVYLARLDTLERHATYLDLLRYMNTDAAIRANASVYSVLDAMGRDADDAGSAWVSQWYARNCYIFANIVSVVRPGDRVVVVIGQGHEYLLRELVQLNPNLRHVDPLTYLK
jgi:Family of unknown function (DUF5694)